MDSLLTFGQLLKASVLEIGDGYRAKNNELGGDGPIFLRSAYLQDHGFVREMPERFQRRDAARFGPKISKIGDVVVTTKGNSTGRIGVIRDEQAGAVYSPHLSYWRSKDTSRLDQKFLAYWSRTNEFRSQLAGMAFSTDMAPYFSLRDQLRLRIFLPAIHVQRAIAQVLSALDDMIELNRRASQTLEEMAQAIFRDWFVDFGPVHRKQAGVTDPGAVLGGLIGDPARAAHLAGLFPERFGENGLPEGWEEGTLADITTSAGEVTNPARIDPFTPYIGLEHMPRCSIALTEWERAQKVTSNKARFAAGQVLFGKLRPYFHKVGIAPLDGVCSTDIVVLDAKISRDRPLVATCVSTADFVEFTDRSSTGTKMPRTSWGQMKTYPLAIAPAVVRAMFSNLVGPMHEKVIGNIHENKTLAETRDYLLPKLMSGEIRVREAERQVGRVL